MPESRPHGFTAAHASAPAATSAPTTAARPSTAATAAVRRGAPRPRLGVAIHAGRVRVLPLTVAARLPVSVRRLPLKISASIGVDVVRALRHSIGLLHPGVTLLAARSDAVAVAGAVVEIVVRRELR